METKCPCTLKLIAWVYPRIKLLWANIRYAGSFSFHYVAIKATSYLCESKKTPNNMKFITILTTITFATIAVAGPMQANSQGKDQVEKRQVSAWLPLAQEMVWEYIGWLRWDVDRV